MRYMLLLYLDEKLIDMSPEEMGKWEAFTKGVTAAGVYEDGRALQPVPTATTVRVRSGETVTTDGPFAETKEQLGGFYLVDAKDLDEAISIAARIPSARLGTIGVRPSWNSEGSRLGDSRACQPLLTSYCRRSSKRIARGSCRR